MCVCAQHWEQPDATEEERGQSGTDSEQSRSCSWQSKTPNDPECLFLMEIQTLCFKGGLWRIEWLSFHSLSFH